MNSVNRSRYTTAVLAAALAGGTVTLVSWGPLPPGGRLPPAAIAHYDDMSPQANPHSPQDAMTESTIVPGSTPLPESTPAPEASDPARSPARDREPAALSIPDLGVRAEVVRTWMDGNASIVVPEDVLVTGWFDGSRRLDARYGSTVIVGHRDSATQGSGALFAIEELPRGASITVTDRSGVEHDFVIDSVELIDKEALPQEAPRIFTHRGPYRLVLITCGGAFDEAARSYLSNVVITALPASADSD